MGVRHLTFFLLGMLILVGVAFVGLRVTSDFYEITAPVIEDATNEAILSTPPTAGDSVALVENNTDMESTRVDTSQDDEAVIAQWYAPVYEMTIGDSLLMASIADRPETRMQGLSGTPYLPEGIAKLFIFEESSRWGFWMKDMNYAIDIIWVNNEHRIVHIEESVSPETFPQSFTPPVPAQYVIEVPSGYVSRQGIGLGNRIQLPIVVTSSLSE
jgi:uncharacterized membrane protein (UPF0127 family)